MIYVSALRTDCTRTRSRGDVDPIAERNMALIRGQLIRIHYPTKGGRIVLRTEEDWDSNIQADSVRQKRSIFEFRIETERPYFYFKPVFLRGGITMWSRGENFLAADVRHTLGNLSIF